MNTLDWLGLKIARFFLRRNLRRCGYTKEQIAIIVDFYLGAP